VIATRTVVIDCFPEPAQTYQTGWGVIAVDVIRATTSAVTAVARGRRCFPVPTLEAALKRAASLPNAVLVGELGGHMPFGFDMNNSPAKLARRVDTHRPAVLLSTSGTALMYHAQVADAVYVACFRNHAAVAAFVGGRHERIAVIGSRSRGEFREEDQMCCAWVAEALARSGYAFGDARTEEVVRRWSGAPPEACLVSHSVDFLRRTRQTDDLEFILTHVNDVNAACLLRDGEAVLVAAND
jgi:2-phosphosulfolactate phosphatase